MPIDYTIKAIPTGGLPPPMTPADVKGRDLGSMPFNADEWLSPQHMMLPHRERLAQLNMLVWSWNSRPGASIPDTTRLYSLAGETEAWWRLHGKSVLNHWVLCADGRYYHPWLSEQLNKILKSKRARNLGVSQQEWKKRRETVFLRDDYTCVYCRTRSDILECDHIVSLADGGTSEIDNLATSCGPCNQSKGSLSLDVWMQRRAAA